MVNILCVETVKFVLTSTRELDLFDYGSSESYLKQIKAATELASEDGNSILMFSGGQTSHHPFGRGQSYAALTLAREKDDDKSTLKRRIVTEEYARDSYENLLFSVARFREYTGHYPSKITVVGLSIRKRRFIDLHRAALHWPLTQFEYVSVPFDGGSGGAGGASQQQVELLETKKFKAFMSDPHACTNGVLRSTRVARNPHFRTPPYAISCPELAVLFKICGSHLPVVFAENLPWGGNGGRPTPTIDDVDIPSVSFEPTRDEDADIPNVSSEPRKDKKFDDDIMSVSWEPMRDVDIPSVSSEPKKNKD